MTGASTEIDQEKIKELYDVMFTIDEHYFPNGNEWIAGENVTVADFAFVATISTLVVRIFITAVPVATERVCLCPDGPPLRHELSKTFQTAI